VYVIMHVDWLFGKTNLDPYLAIIHAAVLKAFPPESAASNE